MQDGGSSDGQRGPSEDEKFAVTAPSTKLPQGGAAISCIGEKFTANPVTSSLARPLRVRSQLLLSDD